MTEARVTISRLARAAGVNSETVRFYERRGQPPEPPRTAAGYRLYPASAVERIRFIRHAKVLGFTLEEIEDLLSLRRDPGCTCGDVKERADRKIADIDRRVAALTAMRRALADIAAACPGDGPASDCPILAATISSRVILVRIRHCTGGALSIRCRCVPGVTTVTLRGRLEVSEETLSRLGEDFAVSYGEAAGTDLDLATVAHFARLAGYGLVAEQATGQGTKVADMRARALIGPPPLGRTMLCGEVEEGTKD